MWQQTPHTASLLTNSAGFTSQYTIIGISVHCSIAVHLYGFSFMTQEQNRVLH